MSTPAIEIPDRYNMATHFVDRHISEGRGDKVAIISEGRKVTYRQFYEMVNRVGNGLRELGVGSGDRVLILLPDCPEFGAAYLGTVKSGAVAVLTNTALRGPDYSYFLDESEARALIIDAAFWTTVQPVLGERKSLQHVIVRGDVAGEHLNWGHWIGEQSTELTAADTAKDDIAFWLWTSGSTGLSKGALHRHRDWNYCSECFGRAILDIGPDDITFSSSKLFHAYGLGNALMFPLHVGATTVLYPGRPSPDVILKIADDQRPTLFYSVPTLYAAMLATTDSENPYDLSSVRHCVSAAEPLPPAIFTRWQERFGLEILDAIGSTEVLHMYASSRPGNVRPGSTGQPILGYDVRISDEEGHEVEAGAVGDLWVLGPSTAPSYWNRDELNREKWKDGWFFSGDKYYRDEDGFLFYAGRSDDMFKVSGQWVSPIEIENCLVEHETVLESAVVAWEDDNKLLKPQAYVVLKAGVEGDEPLIRELQDFVKMRLTPYKYPRLIEFVDDLPKTAAGKIQRFKLRDAE